MSKVRSTAWTIVEPQLYFPFRFEIQLVGFHFEPVIFINRFPV